MEIAYYSVATFLIIAAVLPFITDQHWVFRAADFVRIQLLVLQLSILVFGLAVIDERNGLFWFFQSLTALFILYSAYVLWPYTPLHRARAVASVSTRSASVAVLSINVYQFNREFDQLLLLIEEVKPDIILTMESNKEWEEQLAVLERDYTTHKKVALENTYGMHLYTNLKAQSIQVHHFMADDVPSIEATLETSDGQLFTLFGVHPPPPSPTEEENSKERDGELLSVAKRVKKLNTPVIVVGDFNNVAWARSSVLFRKTSGLIDPRVGRGFVSTFHANYKLFRFPIDLFFHSRHIVVERFKTLRHVGSDHLPLYCRFFITHEASKEADHEDKLEADERQEVNQMIAEGKREESARPVVATE